MTDPIPARLAALKTTPTPALKQQWRDLLASEPPPFNRRYLESRGEPLKVAIFVGGSPAMAPARSARWCR